MKLIVLGFMLIFTIFTSESNAQTSYSVLSGMDGSYSGTFYCQLMDEKLLETYREVRRLNRSAVTRRVKNRAFQHFKQHSNQIRQNINRFLRQNRSQSRINQEDLLDHLNLRRPRHSADFMAGENLQKGAGLCVGGSLDADGVNCNRSYFIREHATPFRNLVSVSQADGQTNVTVCSSRYEGINLEDAYYNRERPHFCHTFSIDANNQLQSAGASRLSSEVAAQELFTSSLTSSIERQDGRNVTIELEHRFLLQAQSWYANNQNSTLEEFTDAMANDDYRQFCTPAVADIERSQVPAINTAPSQRNQSRSSAGN